eukprot:9360441-Pyramimonas_sp.AAC.1
MVGDFSVLPALHSTIQELLDSDGAVVGGVDDGPIRPDPGGSRGSSDAHSFQGGPQGTEEAPDGGPGVLQPRQVPMSLTEAEVPGIPGKPGVPQGVRAGLGREPGGPEDGVQRGHRRQKQGQRTRLAIPTMVLQLTSRASKDLQLLFHSCP